MTKTKKKKTSETKRIEQLLAMQYADVEAYRYNPASIRIRIVDEVFRDKSRIERDKLVRPLLRELPEETLADIMVLLLLTPEETEKSLMNLEFDDPTPSLL